MRVGERSPAPTSRSGQSRPRLGCRASWRSMTRGEGIAMSSVRSIVQRAAAALACAAAAAGSAHAVDIHVGSYTKTGIGAEFATPYDTFSFVGNSLTVAASSTPVAVSLGSYSFEVGPNCYGCTLTPSLDALIDITVDGVTQQFDLPYAWYSSGPSDFLTFSK